MIITVQLINITKLLSGTITKALIKLKYIQAYKKHKQPTKIPTLLCRKKVLKKLLQVSKALIATTVKQKNLLILVCKTKL